MGWFPRVVLFVGALWLLYPIVTWKGSLKGSDSWKVILVLAFNNVACIVVAGFLMLCACLGRVPW